MSLCPCGSQKNYIACCKPYINEKKVPQTPEQLMRSRYTAYSQGQINYIKKTMMGKPLMDFNEVEAQNWAENSQWLGLDVLEFTQENLNLGYVEFIATLIERNQLKTIHERSEFHQHNGRWFYVDGINKQNRIKNQAKLSRNGRCPCGSGKKFKNCHER
jgi:SEC-C motif-containing protein